LLGCRAILAGGFSSRAFGKESHYAELQQARRLRGAFATAAALAALALAAIRLYGVIAFAVGQRTREFGIRFALGATDGDVLRLVLRRGLILVLAGIAGGVVGSLALTHFLTHYLYNVKPTDPATLAAVSLLPLVVALLAPWLPARPATKVDPMIALRCE